jgi:hypothetical protein
LTIDEDPDGEYYQFKIFVNQTDATEFYIKTDRRFKLKGMKIWFLPE